MNGIWVSRFSRRNGGGGALLAVMLGAMAMSPIPAWGQQVPPRDVPGMWIRFSTRTAESEPSWQVARVIDITSEYLVVEPLGEGALAVDRGIVTRVQRSEGWRPRTARGAGIGFAAGAALAGGLFFGADCDYCVAFAGAGLGVGWWAGARDIRLEWMIVPLERVDVMIRPRRIAGVGVRVGVGPW